MKHVSDEQRRLSQEDQANGCCPTESFRLCSTPVKSTQELIAVYGSLLRAEGGLSALGAAALLAYIGPAQIRGELFDLGDYPGLCWDGQTPRGQVGVAGELFAIRDSSVLAILDDYEGCGSGSARPDNSVGFQRRRVPLIQPTVEAWVYLYYGSVIGLPRILGVTWSEYKTARR